MNADKFAEYLQRLNQQTRFIAITHRRGTMEHADVLYGVTMQEEVRIENSDPGGFGNRKQAGDEKYLKGKNHMSFFQKLKAGLSKTKEGMRQKIWTACLAATKSKKNFMKNWKKS